MNLKRIIALTLSVLILVTCFASCGDIAPSPIMKYTSSVVMGSVDSGTVASNDKYEMIWDSARACVQIKDKATGYIWSTVPYDYYMNGEGTTRAENLLNSPIIINYISPNNTTMKTVNGSTVFEEGKISAKAIEDGIQVVFFFENVQITVPLIYKLYDDHFTVTVDLAGVMEGENKLYQVQIAPYLVSAAASEEKDSYIFVPSGSGALMYTDERNGDDRLFEGEVFGDDLAKFNDHKISSIKDINLPVFGATSGDNSIFAIIEEGAAACKITANAGASSLGYSNAAAVFTLRGHNIELVEKAEGNYERINSYSDGLISSNCTVAYYPLSGEDSGYSGMAELYREYLTEKYGMSANTATSSLYLQMIGGVMIDKSFVGIPYQTLAPTTTVDKASAIISDLTSTLGTTPVVQLKGYGATGTSVGKIGGGFKIASKLGSFADIVKLQETTDIYFDMDVVRFDSSGNGFSASSDTAKAENGARAYQYYYAVAMGEQDEDAGRYSLLARRELGNAVAKATAALTKKGIKGLSFSTLGSLAYSDYYSPSYYSKGNIDTDVAASLTETAKSAKIMTSTANSYAAALSSHVLAAPTATAEYAVFDETVPFYQMVFKGSVSLSTEAVNLVADPREELLGAVESGSGLLYTVIDTYNAQFLMDDSALAGSVYSDNRDSIISGYNEVKDVLAKVSNAKIKSHSILENGVRETVFDNGVVVYVNYSDSAATTYAGTVEAESFAVSDEATVNAAKANADTQNNGEGEEANE